MLTVYAVPVFLLLILIELYIDKVKKTNYYRTNDSFGSLTLGITSKTSDLIVFGLGALILREVANHYQFIVWPKEVWWVWVITFILHDLTYYWSHRMAHKINFWWAGHAIHHQSEEFNLTTALRQPSSSILIFVFSIPILLLGAPFDIYITCAAVNLIYQFWVHTQHIDHLSILEKFMVTPSHHRVHHAQNTLYIDRNYGGVFIIWDKIFGTFQQELKEERVIFGIRHQLKTINPIKANFQVWAELAQDAWYTRGWWDKFRIWFMPTGWRPDDVKEIYPRAKTDLTHLQKYNPGSSSNVKFYTIFQLIIAFPVNTYFLFQAENLSYVMTILCWLVITAPLITGAWLLEGKNRQVEIVRLLLTWPVFWILGHALPTMIWWAGLAYLACSSIWLLFLTSKANYLTKEQLSV